MSKVLICEDSIPEARLLQHAISKECVHASDGEIALKMLRDDKSIAIVILDLNLPVVSGMEFLREVGSDPYLNRVPIIVLTGDKRKSVIEAVYDSGARSYIAKPSNLAELRSKVDSIEDYWFNCVTLPDRD